MSVTLPAPLPGKSGRSLRTRWRWTMVLGLSLLIVTVVASTTLILFLEGRQAVATQHDMLTEQAGLTVQQTFLAAQQTVTFAADGTLNESDLQRLLDTLPALRSITVVDFNGREVRRVPARSGDAPDWSDHPALQDEATTQIEAGDSPTIWFSVPTTDHILVAEVDPAALWGAVVNSHPADESDLFLVSSTGQIIAHGTGINVEGDPADTPTFDAARADGSGIRFYNGLRDHLVVGYARELPDLDLVVMAETPLSHYTSMLVRVIALWGLALAFTVAIGEWLVRRILRTILKPLDVLRQGARVVGTGDYRYRIRVPEHTDRELADLGRAFNDMIIRLQESQRQIDAYTYEMESIVDLRARELSRKALQLEVAAEVSGKIATILDPRALIREVVDLLRERFKIYHVEILLLDDSSGLLIPSNAQTSKIAPTRLQKDSGSLLMWAMRHGRTIHVPDVSEESRYQPNPELPATQCLLIIPLKFGGRAIGVLDLEAEHRDAFQKDEIAVLEGLANEIAVSLHNAQVFDALETANRDLAQATLQAKQANVVKSRFLLNASHKLRTPLNAIIGYSETILSGIYGEVPEKMQDRQRRILENGRVLQALIEDMLDLSSIEAGTMEIKLEWVALSPLLEEVMNAARAYHQMGYEDHDLTLRLDVNGALPDVWADVNRLRYILINLMSNAVKFTERGEVVMTAESTDDSIIIRVRDTGQGISDEELAHLFEPFQHQRGSTSSEGKGTGLGLPVSRMLAQMHGGDLTVESTLREGSCFTLRLPRRNGDSA